MEIVDKEETSASIPPIVLIDEENITWVVVEKKVNRRWCNKQTSATTTKSFICEICPKIYKIEKNSAKHYISYLWRKTQVSIIFDCFNLKLASSSKSNVINISK